MFRNWIVKIILSKYLKFWHWARFFGKNKHGDKKEFSHHDPSCLSVWKFQLGNGQNWLLPISLSLSLSLGWAGSSTRPFLSPAPNSQRDFNGVYLNSAEERTRSKQCRGQILLDFSRCFNSLNSLWGFLKILRVIFSHQSENHKSFALHF